MDLIKTKALVQLIGDPLAVSILLLTALVMGLVIAITYKKTHRGFSYSQGFAVTLVLITVITAFIIIFIQDNVARAIGIFGAFSIIRFRTAVKDTRDTAFVFYALLWLFRLF